LNKLDQFLTRVEGLLARLENVLPGSQAQTLDWQAAAAFRWDHQQRSLHPVENFSAYSTD